MPGYPGDLGTLLNPCSILVVEMRTLQLQEMQDSLAVGRGLHEMESTGAYGNGVELNLHGYSKKLTEGVNKGKFQCSLCGKISGKKDDAFKHVESIHFPGSLEYQCEQCGKKFDTKEKLHTHRRKYTKN